MCSSPGSHPPTAGTTALPTPGPWHFQLPCPVPSGGKQGEERKAVWEEQRLALDCSSGGQRLPGLALPSRFLLREP